MQKRLINYFLLIIFILLVAPAHAQKKGYSQGYIINSEGETIEGWVKDRSTGTFIELYSRIRFKGENRSYNKRYSASEIQGYGYNNQHFESMPLMEESQFFNFRYYLDDSYDRDFLKVMAWTDDLTYYHWEYIDSESNYVDYIPLFHRPGSSEMVRVTQGILGLKRKKLMEYFRDCPSLVHALEQKQLSQIDQVFDFYTQRCVSNSK